MKTSELREVIACLPKGRTLFRYTKDDYAFRLLSRAAQSHATLEELRKSSFGNLLQKPVVREAMAKGSSAQWFGPQFGACREGQQTYRLSLDEWGDDDDDWDWRQTTRPGKSLVLQLNLTGRHHEMMVRMLGDKGYDPFHFGCHPAREGRNATLAWARLDFDLESREALIEEIQTDRLRDVRSLMRENVCKGCGQIHWYGYRLDPREVKRFWEEEMRHHEAMWEEAMMMAALEFLFEEIGIRRVFYHTFELGCRLKGITESFPPRSLYTSLPKKFCFRTTGEVPAFIRGSKFRRGELKKAATDSRFYVIE
ncbi:MAG: hypothetical protein ACSHYB_18890 [Roseibacillus sp.]